MADNRSENGGTQNGQYRAKTVDLAWLAGIIDGEGYIGAQVVKNSYYRKDGNRGLYHAGLRVAVKNTDIRMLIKMNEIVRQITGRTFSILWDRPHTLAKFKIYNLTVSSQGAVQKLLESVLPYLVCKREQAELAVEFCVSRSKGLSYTEDDRAVIERLQDCKRRTKEPLPTGVQTERSAPRG